MHLCLHLPGLLERAAAAPPHALRTLAQRLAGVAPTIERDGAIAAMAPLYGVARQQDWPLAAIRAAAAGMLPGTRYWLRATPVLLEPSHDDVRVVGPVTDIDGTQASAFIATLTRHFASDGVSFIAAAASDWVAALDRAPVLATRPLATAIGDRVRTHLATGADAPLWRRWGQEIEMLLHDHPVNGARAQQGRSIVNSVWWQHGGVYPRPASVSVHTWSEHEDLRALAQHVGALATSLPRDADALWHGSARSTVAATIVATIVEADIDALDTHWIAPAVKALDAGRMESIDLIADAPGKPAVRWRLAPRAWWSRMLPIRRASLADVLAQLDSAICRTGA